MYFAPLIFCCYSATQVFIYTAPTDHMSMVQPGEGLDSSCKLSNCYHLTFHALYDFCVLFIYGFTFYCFSLISSRYLGLFTDIRTRESLLSWIIPILGCTGVYCLDSFLCFGHVFCSDCLISGSLLQTSLSLLPTLCQTIVHYRHHFIKIVPKCTRFWTPDCNIPWRSTLLLYWSKPTVNLPLAAKLMSLWRAVTLSQCLAFIVGSWTLYPDVGYMLLLPTRGKTHFYCRGSRIKTNWNTALYLEIHVLFISFVLSFLIWKGKQCIWPLCHILKSRVLNRKAKCVWVDKWPLICKTCCLHSSDLQWRYCLLYPKRNNSKVCAF